MWNTMVNRIHDHVRQVCPSKSTTLMLVDASSNEFGVVLLSEGKIVAMFNWSNIIPRQHSNTSNIEGYIKSLRAMRSVLIGKRFVIHTNNWYVLRTLRGQTWKDADTSLSYLPRLLLVHRVPLVMDPFLQRVSR